MHQHTKECSNGCTHLAAQNEILAAAMVNDPPCHWQVDDWAYCEGLDKEFKVLAIKDHLLQECDILWIATSACVKITTSECAYCREQKPRAKQERYSASVYAGRMCDDCAYRKYRDHCGLDDTPMLTQADLSEDLEPDDWGP